MALKSFWRETLIRLFYANLSYISLVIRAAWHLFITLKSSLDTTPLCPRILVLLRTPKLVALCHV